MVADVARRFPGKSFTFPLEHLSPDSYTAESKSKPQRLKPVLGFHRCKQSGRKTSLSVEQRTSGAEARHGQKFIGTTEVVPFPSP